MVELDEKLAAALETLVKDGQFVSRNEFLIIMTEHFEPGSAENPMQVRLDRASNQIKQAFIDAGWARLSEFQRHPERFGEPVPVDETKQTLTMSAPRKLVVTICSVHEDGIGGSTQTFAVKVGEPLRVAHPLETRISEIVVDGFEQA
jgi:hypothetical protein